LTEYWKGTVLSPVSDLFIPNRSTPYGVLSSLGMNTGFISASARRSDIGKNLLPGALAAVNAAGYPDSP